ncbi:DUF1311 domain-containing protein [Xanthomonas prunicola]|uniref:DUF1311 domain-containing protein n=1 Tax=Xanthomonas prunicola TaxID=2053930 RepID=A0A9Q9J1U3_9XANT|nr:lysozyme inhibitor LprI family protein [Xanthomonas prunicola]USJ01764.1 DUF1311 domain-containing protein [Xanthomonas prunicola]UXA50253.1 DUF1311 domain-containing protein [Xanthomonas prunicola]UXA52020.1 DUF1311 domain-containing protein [Xanthomonas prunicola]UXA58559.1 DUF1311 domain-containing protein [Xanthomonas prunicola]UXA60703.1 DUF1311 domain-containing protein [Xanthomonas prunicola]
MVSKKHKSDEFSAQRRHSAVTWMATSLLLALTGCSSPDVGATTQSKSGTSSKANTDCSQAGANSDREACLLALSKNDCQASGPACVALQQSHAIDERMTATEKQIISKARTRYSSYTSDDPAYLDDLEKNFVASANAWRSYRDSYCQAEPMVQGMSRSELEELSAACKASITLSRVQQLEQLAKSIP